MDRYYDIMLQHYLDAVVQNNIPLVQEALQHNHIMASNQDLDNALILASLHGHYDMVKFLVHQIPEKYRREYINMGNQLGITPVIAACASGNVKLLNFLLTTLFTNNDEISLPVTDLGNTCIGIACANGRLEIVKYLLAGGASLEMVKGSLCPDPLMLAMLNEHDDTLLYFYLPSLAHSTKLSLYPPETQEEIRNGAEYSADMVPKVDIDEFCPQFHNLNILALAAVLQKNEMFELLCKLGADMDVILPESGNSIRAVADKYGFDVTSSFSISDVQSYRDQSFSSSAESESKKSSTKKHSSTLKKLERMLRLFKKL